MLQERPRWWPTFSSTLRSTAITARIGSALGVAIAVLFVTGLLSHYQYEPWRWLPEPAAPASVQESAPEGIVAMPHALPAA